MTAVVKAESLTKRFGEVSAVTDLSFALEAGTITGFLGPNGVGKTTTMRVILGLDRPDEGHRADRRPSVSEPAAPANEGRRPAGRRSAAAPQPRRTAHNHLLRQRLGIAAALLGNPPMLMLDEPFSGMDPEGIVWMRGLLASLTSMIDTAIPPLDGVETVTVVLSRGRCLARSRGVPSPQAGHPAVLGRGDPCLANYLWDGGRVRVVDFEDSAPSGRAFELAIPTEHISAWSDARPDADNRLFVTRPAPWSARPVASSGR